MEVPDAREFHLFNAQKRSDFSMSSDRNPQPETLTPAKPMPNPWSCVSGAGVAGGIAFVLYRLTIGLAQIFAHQPVQSSSLLVQRISAAVRTMFIGLSAMGTGIFALAALGLFGLGVQLLLQRPKDSSEPQNQQGEP